MAVEDGEEMARKRDSISLTSICKFTAVIIKNIKQKKSLQTCRTHDKQQTFQ
jgi:hypothetical protein